MNKEDIFLAKIKDAKTKAQLNNQITLFRFLNLHEQELISFHMGKDCYVYFSEGEYKRCAISPFEIKPDLRISILKVVYDKRYLTLSHRNILGGLLSLGIERNILGDILSDGKDYYVSCCLEMKEYLTRAVLDSTVRFSLEEVDNVPISSSEEYEAKVYFLSSVRLDACISHVYGLSRKQAYDMVTQGYIKVNHLECLNPSKVLAENDLVSVRTKGRMKIFSIKDKTKSGRIKVEIGRL